MINDDPLSTGTIDTKPLPEDTTPLPQRLTEGDRSRAVPGGAVRPRRHHRRYRARPRRRGEQDAARPRPRNAAARNAAAVSRRRARADCSAARSRSGRSITTSPRCATNFSRTTKRICASRRRSFRASTRLLDQLDARGVRWGIVTNKVTRFAAPLVGAAGARYARRLPRLRRHHAAFEAASRAAPACGRIAGCRAGAHRLCRRRSARRAGRVRGGHDHRGGRLRLLRRRHSAAPLARESRGRFAGRTAAFAARHRLELARRNGGLKDAPIRLTCVFRGIILIPLWGRPGFDRGCEAARAYRGPVTSLINGKNVTANDETFALAA